MKTCITGPVDQNAYLCGGFVNLHSISYGYYLQNTYRLVCDMCPMCKEIADDPMFRLSVLEI